MGRSKSIIKKQSYIWNVQDDIPVGYQELEYIFRED